LSYRWSNLTASAWEYDAPITFFGSGDLFGVDVLERQNGEPALEMLN
jgi:hypothetical protein